MLDQVSLADAMGLRVAQQSTHNVELMKAWPDLQPSFTSGLLIPALDDLRIIFQDIAQALSRQDASPEVVGFDPLRVGRIARAVVPTLVEGKEPGIIPLEVGAETYFLVVHREMRHATPESKEHFTWVTVSLVLLDGIRDALFGEEVFQLEGYDRQTIEEEAKVEREVGLVPAVTKLSRDRETILIVEDAGLLVARRRRTVEEIDMMRSVLEPLA